ncbi:MAG: hypothetical protein AAF547_18145 [Actinomycetota bacterium]
MTGTEGATLAAQVAAMLEAAWRPPGFCVPNHDVYPHQWLWDSCFHALVWSAVGSDRGVTEVANVLATQAPDGFVPHMTYWLDPDAHAAFWGRSGASTITQPPMFGHAIAELVRAGQSVAADTFDRAARGLHHLADRPRTPAGLVPVYHPWETGCDDSARWDAWLDPAVGGAEVEPAARQASWRATKSALVGSLELGPHGHATGNPDFEVGSIGFTALVAFNAAELATVTAAHHDELAAIAAELGAAVTGRWDGTGWPDDGGPSGAGTRSSADAPTLDAMLALLVDPRPDGFAMLTATDRFGAPFGPRGADRSTPTYDPDRYWRGPAWPQLSYLLMVAAARAGLDDEADRLAAALVAGATTSGFAEYWNPESGKGLGARPQSWAGVAVLAERRLRLRGAIAPG